jgi:hypothetical protein
LEFLKIRDTAKWQHQTTSKDVDISYITTARKLNCFKASGIVDFPNWVCVQVMTNGDFRRSYDINMQESRLCEHVATNVWTVHDTSKALGVWPVKIEARDFVVTIYTEIVTFPPVLILFLAC